MARHKKAEKCTISPFLSAKMNNKEGRFLQIGNSFLLSKKTQALRGNAFRLYLALLMEAGGKSNVVFTHSCARKYGIAKTSFDRAWHELAEAGMIRLVGEKPLSQFSPNTFQFVIIWKLDKSV